MIYIDLGLHKGDEIDLFLEIFPRAKVYGFEADPRWAGHCEKRYKEYKNVTIIQKAVSNKNGTEKLYFAEENNGEGNSIFSTKNNVSKDFVEVESVKLSDWIRENIPNYKKETIVLRLNIEGAELHVIEDLVESGMYKYIKVFLGSPNNDILKCSEIAGRNKEHQKRLKDHGIRIYPFCVAKRRISPFALRSLVYFSMKDVFIAGALGVLFVSLFLILSFEFVEGPVGQVVPIDVTIDTTEEALTEIRTKGVAVPDAIRLLDNEEKLAAKKAEIARVVEKKVHPRSAYDIEIVEINDFDGGVEVFARAYKNGVQVGFGRDGTVDIERFLVHMSKGGVYRDYTYLVVEDPTGDIELPHDIVDARGEIVRVPKKFRVDLQESLLRNIEHTVSIMKNKTVGQPEKIIAGKRGNTTSTFNPDANPESTSVDGSASRVNMNEAWATIRAGAGNNSNDSLTFLDFSGIRVSTTNASNWRNMLRTFTLFDTSSLPDTDTIDSATYSLYATSKNDDVTPSSGVMAIRVVATTPASNTAMANSDYANSGTTAQATDINISSISTSAYNDWTLNATGEGNISLTGVTKFGVRHSRDAADDEPTGSHSLGANSGVFFSSADNADSNQYPKLTVEHSSAAEPEATTTPTSARFGNTVKLGNDASW